MREERGDKSLLQRVGAIATELFDAFVSIDDPEDEAAWTQAAASRDQVKPPTERSVDLCSRVGLDISQAPVMELIFNDWESQMPRNGASYFSNVAPSLAAICQSSQDWLEVGEYLCDKVAPVFKRGNGSHQLVCDLVPELINRKVVESVFELRRWVNTIVDRVESFNGRSGADHYNHIRVAVARGEVKTLADLDKWSPAA